jgi:MFS transporter, DHA2 family, multidrug resistance protein
MVVMTGFAIVAVFALRLSHLNLERPVQRLLLAHHPARVGLSLITIPLTQLAVSGLHPRDIPQGVALNNMMRQMGGSFGIAFINTFLDHRTAAHRLEPRHPPRPGRPRDRRPARASSPTRCSPRGATAWEASRRALGLLDSTVQRQASLLSYLDAFRLVAFLSLACVPLILLAGRPGRCPKAAPRPPTSH